MEHKVILKLERITKIYDMGEVKVEALKETSLDIYAGEILVILGPSGSGKSTLLNIMGGMDLPTNGNVFFEKRPPVFYFFVILPVRIAGGIGAEK